MTPDEIMLKEQVDTLEKSVESLDKSVRELTHTSKNLRNQISGLYKENAELKQQIAENTAEVKKLLELLAGDEHGANIGYFKRVQRLESAMKWLDGNKFKAVGIGIAFSVLATVVGIIYAVAKGVIWVMEIGKHTTIVK